MEYILEMKDIHKSFGPVKVLEGIDFSLVQGGKGSSRGQWSR